MTFVSSSSAPPSSPSAPLSALARRAAGFVPTGVAVIQADDAWLTVSSLQWVSCDPPWVSVAVDRASRRGEAVRAASAVTIRLLDEHQGGLARASTPPPADAGGVLMLAGTVERRVAVSTHDLLLVRLTAIDLPDHRRRPQGGKPLVYWRGGLHALTLSYPWLASAETFQAFVAAWESGMLAKAEWTHAAHVAVGACYAMRYGDGALARTREGIRRFNAAVGTANTDTSGYHETLTRFWAEVLAALIADVPPATASTPAEESPESTRARDAEWQAARLAVARYGEDRDLHLLYYSFDVVRSLEARRTWMPPDLAPANRPDSGPTSV